MPLEGARVQGGCFMKSCGSGMSGWGMGGRTSTGAVKNSAAAAAGEQFDSL